MKFLELSHEVERVTLGSKQNAAGLGETLKRLRGHFSAAGKHQLEEEWFLRAVNDNEETGSCCEYMR